jgi:hypothetical protein
MERNYQVRTSSKTHHYLEEILLGCPYCVYKALKGLPVLLALSCLVQAINKIFKYLSWYLVPL